MTNQYKKAIRTPQGALADILATNNKNQYARNAKAAEEKNAFEKAFVLQNLQGNAQWQREQARMEHDDKQKDLDRTEKSKEKSAKRPKFDMAIHSILTTGFKPDKIAAKGWDQNTYQKFLSGMAEMNGYEPDDEPTIIPAVKQKGMFGSEKEVTPEMKVTLFHPKPGIEMAEEETV